MLGLCLSGGGARGAYEIGVCMALKEAGLLDQVEYISGTSIGAVNAVLLACLPVEEVRDIWFNIPTEVLHKSEGFFKRVIYENLDFMKNGLYDLSVLRKIIRKHIDFTKLKENKVFVTISDCGVKDGGITSLIKSSFLHYIRHNKKVIYSKLWEHDKPDIVKQVIASCSIPVVFPAENIDGKQYYDGGLYDNVPVTPLVEAGCDEVVVIHLDRLPYFYKKKYPDICFHVIKSRHMLGAILNFDPKQSQIRFQYGYDDCIDYLIKNNLIEKSKTPSLT